MVDPRGLRACPRSASLPLLAAGPFGLDLTMVWNRGVTFGLLSGSGSLAPPGPRPAGRGDRRLPAALDGAGGERG